MQALRGEWNLFPAEALLVAQSMDIPTQFQSEGKWKQKRKHVPDEDEEDKHTHEDNAANTFRNHMQNVALHRLAEVSRDVPEKDVA